jgi:hypothetical protein
MHRSGLDSGIKWAIAIVTMYQKPVTRRPFEGIRVHPFLIRVKFLRDSNIRDWPAVRTLTRIRKG